MNAKAPRNEYCDKQMMEYYRETHPLTGYIYFIKEEKEKHDKEAKANGGITSFYLVPYNIQHHDSFHYRIEWISRSSFSSPSFSFKFNALGLQAASALMSKDELHSKILKGELVLNANGLEKALIFSRLIKKR